MKVKRIEVSSLPPHCSVCKFFKEEDDFSVWNQFKALFGCSNPRRVYTCILTEEQIKFDLLPPKQPLLSDKCPLVLRAETKTESVTASIEWLRDINSSRKGFDDMKEKTLTHLREYYKILEKEENKNEAD